MRPLSAHPLAAWPAFPLRSGKPPLPLRSALRALCAIAAALPWALGPTAAAASDTATLPTATTSAQLRPTPAADPARAAAPTTARAPHQLQLSDGGSTTTWAHSLRFAPIFAAAGRRARRIGSLHLYTEDGYPEVYMLLNERLEADGETWVRLRLPARPNGQIGWVRRTALGAFHVTHWLLAVDRTRHYMTAYWRGHRRFRAPVGVGKPETPTPAGSFWIREKFPISERSSGYWPAAFGTADYSQLSEWPNGGVVGIHGPYNQPQQIPGAPSHGCIRMLPGALGWLYRHIPVGAALHVI